MDQGLRIDRIRRTVLEAIAELAGREVTWPLVTETVLLRDPHHAGRRFQYGGIRRPVWFVDQDVIEFFTADGQFLKTVALDQPGRREAA